MTHSVGVIGCGHMGGAIAQRLLQGGFAAVVYDLDNARLAEMAQAGAQIAASAGDVGDRAEIVLACLPSVDASFQTAAAIRQGRAIRCYVETSTIGAPALSRISKELQPRGIELLDMPVSGGPSWAREGKLTGILSGSVSARQTAHEVLSCITGRLIVVGDEPGQAQIAKIVNNMLSLTGMVIACEAIVSGVAAGIDADKLIEVINAGTGRNSATVDKFPKAVLPRTFDYGGPIGLGNKDIDLFLELQRNMVPADSLGQCVADLWQRITRELGYNADLSEMVKYFEKRAGAEVRGGQSNLI